MDASLTKKRGAPCIVAISGALAAGKDELASYLVKHHDAAAIEVGAFARYICEEFGNDKQALRYDRWVSNLGDYGSAYILQRLVDEIVENGDEIPETVAITGVRTPAEAAFLKAHFGSRILLVFVKVGDRKTRYERALNRHLATDPENFQGFVELDERMKVDNALEETAEWADVIIWNDGSLEDYRARIETEIMPYLRKEHV